MKSEKQTFLKALRTYTGAHRARREVEQEVPPLPDFEAMAETMRQEYRSKLADAREARLRDKREEERERPKRTPIFLRFVLPLAAVLMIGGFLSMMWHPSEFIDRSSPGDNQRAGEVALPNRLSADFENNSIRFHGDGIDLSGKLHQARESADTVVYEVVASGKDSHGLEAIFAGEASFKRVKAGGALRSYRDVQSIAVSGGLGITNGAVYPQKRTYTR